MKKISSLTIPKNVREIDYLLGSFKSVAVLSEKIISAAEDTLSLTILFRIDKTIEVHIPDGIREIGRHAFNEKDVHDRFLPSYKEYEREQLEMIMSSYKTIKDLSCEELKAIRAQMPSDIKKRYDYLKNCKWLKYVEFPASVSLSPIYRDIEIMRGEFHAPIDYDYFEKGYHYTENDFELRL